MIAPFSSFIYPESSSRVLSASFSPTEFCSSYANEKLSPNADAKSSALKSLKYEPSVAVADVADAASDNISPEMHTEKITPKAVTSDNIRFAILLSILNIFLSI